jgi:hypothetical protein
MAYVSQIGNKHLGKYVRKLEEHLNLNGGKVRIQPIFKSGRIWSFFIAIIP